MQKIELSKGIYSSVIGFGCAPVLGAVDAKRAKRAIELAMDLGVNHFDLGRSYGYGEAERFVGGLLKNRRQDVVIASKFGLEANWKAGLLRSAKPLIRTLKRSLFRASENEPKNIAGPAIASHFIDRIALNKKEMRRSLEMSLRELNTDYLDYFFIHEPQEEILNIEELLIEFERLKSEGKIRASGLAYMLEQDQIHAPYKNHLDVLQFNRASNHKEYENAVADRSNQANIIFSPFRFGEPNVSAEQKLVKLSTDFPKSVILCSMFSEKHIRQNTSCFR